MNTQNLEVKTAIMAAGLTQKAVAEHMGLNRKWLSKKLSTKLSADGYARIMQAIEELKETGNEA